MAKRKLKTFTVNELTDLLEQHGSLPKVAAAKGVTPRALQKWVKKHCERKVTYQCQQEQTA